MEWVGLLAIVAILLVALLAAGVRVPGTELARAVASRILCAAALADSCGEEPALIAAYGSELAGLARELMPAIAFERGSRALPVDFRDCRRPACSDGTRRGLVHRTDAGLPVTAFVRVVDCREGGDDAGAALAAGAGGASVAGAEPAGGGDATGPEPAGGEGSAGPEPAGGWDAARCSGPRAGNLYVQYWLYYPESATLRGVPVAGAAGYHRDDWESVMFRIRPDGGVEQRASAHNGYNHRGGIANAGAEAGVAPLEDLAETVGARPRGGWGPQTGLLLVSGGSHAGSVGGYLDVDRLVPGRRVRLVPLEPIATAAGDRHRFEVTPPWRKRVWRDPEAAGTN